MIAFYREQSDLTDHTQVYTAWMTWCTTKPQQIRGLQARRGWGEGGTHHRW